MTGDGILKTGTDTITVHTASDHHGGGADITTRSTVHTGVHGITTLAECTDTMTLGTTETHGTTAECTATMTTTDSTALGDTTHGTTADTTETTTQDTGEDITEAGTAGMILGTITTTVGITLTTYTALHT